MSDTGVVRIVSGREWRERAEKAEAEVARLRTLIADALPLMEDEWIGLNGPIGEGGEWIVAARAALGSE